MSLQEINDLISFLLSGAMEDLTNCGRDDEFERHVIQGRVEALRSLTEAIEGVVNPKPITTTKGEVDGRRPEHRRR